MSFIELQFLVISVTCVIQRAPVIHQTIELVKDFLLLFALTIESKAIRPPYILFNLQSEKEK